MIEEIDGTIYINREDLIEKPLWYHKKNIMQTPTGYGNKLTMSYKVPYNGRKYRVYCTCYSNIGTCYIISKGEKIFVDVY